jgi:hypothetical protein
MRYEVAVGNLAAVATNTPHAALGAPTRRLFVREMGMFLGSAVASRWALARATNTPVATTTQLAQQLDPADVAATGVIQSAWSTPPTAAAIGVNRFRVIDLPATVGSGIVWTWPGDTEPVVPTGANGPICLWNDGGANDGTLDWYIQLRE